VRSASGKKGALPGAEGPGRAKGAPGTGKNRAGKAARWFRRAVQAVREIVWPEGAVCLGCGRISRGECLCPACRRELRETGLLESWETREISGVRAWSMRPHRGIARKLILRLKHGAEKRAAAELAALIRTRPPAFPECLPGTVVTWVPGPRRRIRERCIDHGQELARAIAAELGLKSEALLRRQGNDRPQARLNMEQRQKNLRNAFAPVRQIREPVLLVDDVLTTGTTARRCIAALREGGAEEIRLLTATYAGRRGE